MIKSEKYHVPGWRNWQTHYLEAVALERACWFKLIPGTNFSSTKLMSTVVSLYEFKEARDLADVILRVNSRHVSTSEMVDELRLHNQKTNTRSQDLCDTQKDLSQKPKATPTAD